MSYILYMAHTPVSKVVPPLSGGDRLVSGGSAIDKQFEADRLPMLGERANGSAGAKTLATIRLEITVCLRGFNNSRSSKKIISCRLGEDNGGRTQRKSIYTCLSYL